MRSQRNDQNYLDMDRVILPTLKAPTLTKAELAVLLVEQLGLNRRESKDMVDAFFGLIDVALIGEQDVHLMGFGSFKIRRKAARPGRNLRTGETVPIKARKVVTFLPSRKLKGQLQGAITNGDELE